MSIYIYSKWKSSPPGNPVQFYSELNQSNYETRKVEVFSNGKMNYASATKSTGDTKLGIVPVPPINEIMTYTEFDIKKITKKRFEDIWAKATKR